MIRREPFSQYRSVFNLLYHRKSDNMIVNSFYHGCITVTLTWLGARLRAATRANSVGKLVRVGIKPGLFMKAGRPYGSEMQDGHMTAVSSARTHRAVHE